MQQTSTVKLPVFLLRFQTEEDTLKVNKSGITDEKTFNGNYFEVEGNDESIKYEKN